MNELSFLDELRTIACNGLEYAEDPYDRERYERLLGLVAEAYGAAFELPPSSAAAAFADEVGHVTPKVGARAVTVDEEGQVLTFRRTDDGTWSLPGGFSEVGEQPHETAVRETREETGLAVEPVELRGVYWRPPGRHPHGFVGITYRCRRVGGTTTGSHESERVAFREPATVDNWHRDHGEVVRDVLG